MNHITKADIDKAIEIINNPIGGDRGSVILNKSHYMYLCGMVQNMAKRISELEKAAIVWHPYPAEKPEPEPKPEHPAINGYNRYDYIPVEGIRQPKPEPAKEQFKVGDWVEYSDGTLQQAIIEAYSGQPGEQMVYVWHPQTAHSAKTPLQSITRKLDPSEVVIRIGCLEGTVEPGCSDTTIMIVPIGYNGFGDVGIIPVYMLDAPTRSLVESLLKAQEEK